MHTLVPLSFHAHLLASNTATGFPRQGLLGTQPIPVSEENITCHLCWSLPYHLSLAAMCPAAARSCLPAPTSTSISYLTTWHKGQPWASSKPDWLNLAPGDPALHLLSSPFGFSEAFSWSRAPSPDFVLGYHVFHLPGRHGGSCQQAAASSQTAGEIAVFCGHYHHTPPGPPFRAVYVYALGLQPINPCPSARVPAAAAAFPISVPASGGPSPRIRGTTER